MYFFFASRSSDFINHSYDYRPNWTPHNPITIIIISKVETFVCAVLATAKWPKFCFEANGYLSVDFTSTYTLPNHEREFLFYGHVFVSDFVTTLVTHFAQFARRRSRHLGRRLQECVIMTIDPGTSSVVASSSCLVELLHAFLVVANERGFLCLSKNL